MINAKEEGRPFDLSRYRARVKSSVREAVEKQAAAGIDISADGEMGRVGFIPYVNERLSGIEPRQAARGQHQWRRSREYQHCDLIWSQGVADANLAPRDDDETARRSLTRNSRHRNSVISPTRLYHITSINHHRSR
jgi:hypothetical protein